MKFFSSWVLFSALLALSLCVYGCNKPKGPRTTEVFGTVTLDGVPLEAGSVTFDPLDRLGGSSAAGIEGGLYRLQCETGPQKVSIMSNRETGKKGPYGEPVTEQFIPVKYNQKTELTADVPLVGPAELNFELKTKE